MVKLIVLNVNTKYVEINASIELKITFKKWTNKNVISYMNIGS